MILNVLLIVSGWLFMSIAVLLMLTIIGFLPALGFAGVGFWLFMTGVFRWNDARQQ